MKKLVILGICLALAVAFSALAYQTFQKETALSDVIIPVKVVGDEEYRQLRQNTWQGEAKNLLEEAFELYNRDFQIHFEIAEFVEWNSPDLKPLEEGWYDLSGTQWIIDNAARDIPSEGKIVIVLTSEDLTGRYPGIATVTKERGFEEYYVLVWADSKNPRNALVHEIAHLFGAEHPSELGEDYSEKYPSIMDPVEVFNISVFDPKNQEIILKNRDKFQKI